MSDLKRLLNAANVVDGYFKFNGLSGRPDALAGVAVEDWDTCLVTDWALAAVSGHGINIRNRPDTSTGRPCQPQVA